MFRPVLKFSSLNGEPLKIQERHKEQLLLSFFQFIQQHSTPNELFTQWFLQRQSIHETTVEILKGHWTIQGQSSQILMDLPLLKIAQRTICLSGLLASLELVTIHLRLSISQFLPFLGQFFVTIMAQFQPILVLDNPQHLIQFTEQESDHQQHSLEYIGRTRLK